MQDRLQQAQDTIDIIQQRHDESQRQSNMIIMQLTNQLAVLFTSRSVQKTLALEDKSRIIDDMQNRSLWRRVKMVFGFSTT